MFRTAGQVLALGMAIASLSAPGAHAAEPALAIVTGIAPGDLLNVRASASPAGHVETRLGNGAGVKNFGCGDFNGYQWCKVEIADQPGVTGWVPQRYLLAVDPQGTATPTLDEADIRQGSTNTQASAMAGHGDTGGEKAGAAAVAVPPDLAARFGHGPSSSADDAQKPDAQAKLTEAETEAYRAAYAARAKAAASKNQDITGETDASGPNPASTGEKPATAVEGGQAAPRQAGVATEVPVPTPRPDPKGDEPAAQQAEEEPAGGSAQAPSAPTAAAPRAGQTPEPRIVALADPQSSAPTGDATGEIPCARYVGQPMTLCQVGIKRKGDGKADITVTWPDGGTLVIGFYDGKPAGANSGGEFRFTREGGLNMIRIGVSERFEITDKLAFGD